MTGAAVMPTVPPNRVIREGDLPPRRMPPPEPPDSSDPGRDVTSAPRYRIVTNGTVFKVQRRGWVFWHNCQHGPWLLLPHGQPIGHVDHDTLDQALAHRRELEQDDAKQVRRWMVVR